MNALTNEQYERIARYLDGEAVSLTGEEAAAAREVRDAEGALAAPLAVSVDGGLTARVWQRVSKKHTPLWRHAQYALYGAAAAAAVVLALMASHWFAPSAGPAPRTQTPPVVKTTSPDDGVAALRQALDRDLRVTEAHVASFRTPVAPADLDDSDDDASDHHQTPLDAGDRS